MRTKIKKYLETLHKDSEITFGTVVLDPLTFKPSIGIFKNGYPLAHYNPETIQDEIAMNGEIKDIGIHLTFYVE